MSVGLQMPGKCPRCRHKVYFAEEKLALGKVWHKFCFSCCNCRKLLDSSTITTHNDELFCQSCYTRLFSNRWGSFEPNILRPVDGNKSTNSITSDKNAKCHCCCGNCLHPKSSKIQIEESDRLRGGAEMKDDTYFRDGKELQCILESRSSGLVKNELSNSTFVSPLDPESSNRNLIVQRFQFTKRPHSYPPLPLRYHSASRSCQGTNKCHSNLEPITRSNENCCDNRRNCTSKGAEPEEVKEKAEFEKPEMLQERNSNRSRNRSSSINGNSLDGNRRYHTRESVSEKATSGCCPLRNDRNDSGNVCCCHAKNKSRLSMNNYALRNYGDQISVDNNQGSSRPSRCSEGQERAPEGQKSREAELCCCNGAKSSPRESTRDCTCNGVKCLGRSSSEARSPKEIEARTESSYRSSLLSYSDCLGGGLDCQRCGEKVYQAEMQIVSGVPYHNICFSCFCCRKPLEPLTYQEHCQEIYCKQCYVRNFGPRGYGYGVGAGTLQTPL